MFRSILFIFCSLLAYQNIHATDRIEEGVIIGELPNGLHYYVQENSYPSKQASLRLVVKVGSMHEDETEKGVAHFIEHLNFRGSQHFLDGEAIQYLESIGAWFGPDTNAETSIKTTTYILDIPLDKEDALIRSLQILRDFAGNALLHDATIEKERTVVLDELHQSLSSPSLRLAKKCAELFSPKTHLHEMLPIGTQEVISQIEPDALRAFYKKWYRADRMAVIAVGDFDAKEVQQEIETLFSDVLPSDEPAVLTTAFDEIQESPKVFIHFDRELPYTRIELVQLSQADQKVPNAEESIKDRILALLITEYLDDQCYKIVSNGLSISAGGDTDTFFVPEISLSYFYSLLLSKSYEKGMRELQDLLLSIQKNGMSLDDFKAAKNTASHVLQFLKDEIDNQEHTDLAACCIEHFLEDDSLISAETEICLFETLLETLTLEDCNAYLNKHFFEKPFHILFATPDEQIYQNVSEELLRDIFYSEKQGSFVTDCDRNNFVSSPIASFSEKIIDIKQNGPVFEWALENEMKGIFKKTDLEKNQVTLLLHSNKGLSDVPQGDYSSAQMLASYLKESGLCNLSAAEFRNALKYFDISFDLSIMNTRTQITIKTPKKHLETAFQIAHDLFSPHSFNRERWPILIERLEEHYKQVERTPEWAFYKDLLDTNTQNHYLFQYPDCKVLDPANTESLAPYFFETPQDFTAILVGDFDEDEAKELVTTYLATLPKKEKMTFPPLKFDLFFPQGQIQKEFPSGTHTYERIVMTFPYEKKGAPAFSRIARKLIEQRLFQRLRWKEGGTYHVSVNANRPFYPFFKNMDTSITFTCQSSERAALIKATFEEIERCKTELCSEEELNTLKELFLKETNTARLSNDYWLAEIPYCLQKNISFNSLDSEDDLIEDLSKEQMKETLNDLFSSLYHSILIHTPSH